MRALQKMSPTLLLVLWLAVCCSCSQEEHNEEIARRRLEMKFDPVLKEVSVTVALMQTRIQEDKKIECMLAGIFNKPSTPETKQSEQKEGGKEWVKKSLKELGEKSARLCTFYTQAEAETSATFEEIKKRHSLLDQQYSFFIYTSIKELDIFDEKAIGLFASEEECKKLEQYAFDQGMGVKKCQEWKDVLSGSRNP